MSQKERLRKSIEEERVKLNRLMSGGTQLEETYLQSLLLDRLIEQYMDLDGIRQACL